MLEKESICMSCRTPAFLAHLIGRVFQFPTSFPFFFFFKIVLLQIVWPIVIVDCSELPLLLYGKDNV